MTIARGDDMSLQLDIRSRIIRSPDELHDLLAAVLKVANENYKQIVRRYITTHLSQGGSQYSEPAGTIPVASGDTVTSMREIVEGSFASGLAVTFQYGIGTSYWPFIDEPRAPGSLPPELAISTWAAQVGLPQTAVQAIRWGIYRYGWPGRGFWKPFARECERASWVAIREAFKQFNIPFEWVGRDIIVK